MKWLALARRWPKRCRRDCTLFLGNPSLVAFLMRVVVDGGGSRLSCVEVTPSSTPLILEIAGGAALARGLLPFPSPSLLYFFLVFFFFNSSCSIGGQGSPPPLTHSQQSAATSQRGTASPFPLATTGLHKTTTRRASQPMVATMKLWRGLARQ